MQPGGNKVQAGCVTTSTYPVFIVSLVMCVLKGKTPTALQKAKLSETGLPLFSATLLKASKLPDLCPVAWLLRYVSWSGFIWLVGSRSHQRYSDMLWPSKISLFLCSAYLHDNSLIAQVASLLTNATCFQPISWSSSFSRHVATFNSLWLLLASCNPTRAWKVNIS